MNGQWIGRYSGKNSGQLVIDLDDMDTHYEGRAFVYDDNPSLPGTCAFIETPNKSTTFQLSLELLPVDPRSGDPSSWVQLKTLFPEDVVFPRRAEVSISRNNDTLDMSWKTEIKTASSAELPKTRAGEPTEYKPLPEITTWADFKTYVTDVEPRRYIFRGQRGLLRIRTGFHRTGRADLVRFLEKDIKTLHRHLSQRTTHIFNLSIGEQNGAFFNLAQHLHIVDLPLKERPLVMRELSMMGITAGSLFPGFDGACEKLRERHFHS